MKFDIQCTQNNGGRCQKTNVADVIDRPSADTIGHGNLIGREADYIPFIMPKL